MKASEELAALFEHEGTQDYLGEAITLAEHMLQAARLAVMAKASGALVVAALLHDIGHLCDHSPELVLPSDVDHHHEESGAHLLSRWFGPRVCEPVKLHVTAKRYLCHRELHYVAGLSPASQYTLALQGGAMNHAEARAFENRAYSADAVALRRWDEGAKNPSFAAPSFGSFVPLVERVIRSSHD